MNRGFLAVSAALLVAAITLSPVMAYTICSSATPSYTIGSGTPYQYSIGSKGLQAYSIGSGSPYQYTSGSSGLQAYSISSGSPYQYSVASGALQAYSIGMGVPAASTGSCPIVAPTVAPKVEVPVVADTEIEDVEVPVVNDTEAEDVEVPVVNDTEAEDVEEPVVAETEPALLNIVETAVGAGNLNVLVTAVDAAGLADFLAGEGPFTVFAPTDEAFGLLGEIDLNDTDALTEILTYHVADGALMAADVVNMTSIETLEGSSLTIEVTDEGAFVKGARIVQTDVVCSNGVVHIIDAVLMPPAEAEVPPEEVPPVEMPPAEVEEPPAEVPPVVT